MAHSTISLMKHYPTYVDSDTAEFAASVLQAMVPWKPFALAPKSRRVFQWQRGSMAPDIDAIFIKFVNDLESKHKVKVKGVFCNLYVDNNDYCPYHRDQYNADVWTLSLGSTRDFLVKPDEKGTRATTYTLKSGDLYYMAKELHRNHRHSIPKRSGKIGPRISIVFFTEPM